MLSLVVPVVFCWGGVAVPGLEVLLSSLPRTVGLSLGGRVAALGLAAGAWERGDSLVCLEEG